MFEYGMSALVLKICQEYAQATGLNFPPCVQQEINAIAQWVNTHAVKDFKISQDGNVLTFTFYQDKEVTFTVELPEEYVLNVDDLSNFIRGSSTVVVDKSADGKTLEVRLDKSQEVQYITLSPDSATQGTLTVDQFTTLQLNKGNCIILNNEIYRLADNQHTTGVISYVHTGWDSNIVNKSINITVSTRAWTMVKGEASGGGKLYRHRVTYYDSSKYNKFSACFYTSDNIPYNNFTKLFDLAVQLDYIPLYEFGVGESGKITSTHYIPNSLYVVNDKLIALGYKSGVAAQDNGNVTFTTDSDIDIIDTITEV